MSLLGNEGEELYCIETEPHGRSRMKVVLITKPIALLTITLTLTLLFILLSQPRPSSSRTPPDSMARSFVLWLHGLGDSGPANEPIKTFFTSPEFRNTIWSFPSAPSNPVTCNCTLFLVFLVLIITCDFCSCSVFDSCLIFVLCL